MVGTPSYCLKTRLDAKHISNTPQPNNMAALLTPPRTPVDRLCQDPFPDAEPTPTPPIIRSSPSLPTEMLVEILERATIVDVHRCLVASSRLRIAAQMTISPLKQNLEQQGLEYMTHNATTVATATDLLRSLRSRTENWRKFKTDVRLTLPHPGPRTHFCVADGWMVSCHIIRRPDWVLEARTMPHTSSELDCEHAADKIEFEDLNHTVLCDFAIDPSQDLVIAAEFVDDKDMDRRGLFLRPLSLRSMTKHPKMLSGSDKWGADILLDRTLTTSRPNLVISGDHVALYAGPLIIFNWKTGRMYMLPQPPAPESASHTFLSPTALLFLYHEAQDRPIFFKLFQLIDNKDGISGPRWTHTTTFMLPFLNSDGDRHLNDVHIWATPSSLSASEAAANAGSFTPRIRERVKDGDGIVLTRFRGWDQGLDEGTAVVMVFPKSIFLADPSKFGMNPSRPSCKEFTPPLPYHSTNSFYPARNFYDDLDANHLVVPWHIWGPGNVRVIEDRRMVACRGVTSSSHGWRVATMDADNSAFAFNGRISILDFNPRTVDWAIEEAKVETYDRKLGHDMPLPSDVGPVEINTEWNSFIADQRSPSLGSKPIAPVVRRRVITKPTTLKRGALFDEDVVSTLPYYEVLGTPVADVCELRIDQDRLYVARTTRPDAPAGIDVHSF